MDVAGAKALQQRIEQRRNAAGTGASSARDRPEAASCSAPTRRVLEWLHAVADRTASQPPEALAPD
jgi:hypothetical protein